MTAATQPVPIPDPERYGDVPLSSKTWWVVVWLLLLYPIGLIMLGARRTYFRRGDLAVRMPLPQKVMLGAATGILFTVLVVVTPDGGASPGPRLDATTSGIVVDWANACGKAADAAFDLEGRSARYADNTVAFRPIMDACRSASPLAAIALQSSYPDCAEFIQDTPEKIEDISFQAEYMYQTRSGDPDLYLSYADDGFKLYKAWRAGVTDKCPMLLPATDHNPAAD